MKIRSISVLFLVLFSLVSCGKQVTENVSTVDSVSEVTDNKTEKAEEEISYSIGEPFEIRGFEITLK